MRLKRKRTLLLWMLGLLVAVGVAVLASSRINGARGDAGATGAFSATASSTWVSTHEDSTAADSTAPENLPRSRRLPLDRAADGRNTPNAADDVVLLNNQGYNYR